VKSISAGVRVAILFLLLAIGAYLVWKNLGQNPAGKDNYTLFAKFRDASGLPRGTKVVVAGLPKGEVVGLEIEGRYAKVTFKVDNEITVWTSAVIVKKARSLLGDNYLEIDPGEQVRQAPDGTRQSYTKLGPDCPTYKDDDRRKSDVCRQIVNVIEATTPDQLLHRMEQTLPNVDRVLESVRDLSEDVRRIVNGPLQSVATRVDSLVQREAGTVGDIIERADRSMARIEQITADLRAITKGADPRIEHILRNLDDASADAKDLVATAKSELTQTGEALRGKLDKLDGVIENTRSITRKIDEDKGTIGRLVNDPAIADNVEQITDDAGLASLLVEGGVIPWAVKPETTVESLAQSLRAFVAANRSLLRASDDELVVNREGSGELLQDVWQIVFDRAIAGVPVSGERYLFTIGHGNLISFGTPRWSRIDANTVPAIDAGQAQARLVAYMGLGKTDAFDFIDKAKLALIALPGDDSALVWDVKLRVSGGIETWKALVDAHTGAILSFVDANMYAVAKGGVYPTTSDQACPDGCEQPNYPMPFTNIVAGSTQFATSAGIFNCSPSGGIALTNLNGKYFRALDYCGDIAEHVTCDADLDLRTSAGTNCTVPAGSTANSGDTHAARTSYFHLNRIAEHARPWLPNNAWIRSQVDANVNLLQWCNAFWNGSSINYYRDGYGCGNTGEIAGVSQHEWGHGLDYNDGGGYDNPSEAYADVTSFLATHVSCMGRGFRHGVNCTGNGFDCLECTGVRDLDWDKISTHEPARGYPWVANCPSFPNSASPCGQEVHCEGYLAGETIWDLAVRDLPASGLTLADSWQLVDKLWYLSRTGSGGNAYNCFIVDTDGCGATNWFAKLRAVDDDDGDLGNGTPHAAAIFAAFDRHGIACGAVDDPSNQSTTICPAIGAPALTLENGNGFVSLAWTPVAGSTGYRVLRNDVSCSAGFTIIGTTTATNILSFGGAARATQSSGSKGSGRV
jgi:ABC-type transporter Mla subunit MlaD